MPLRKITLPKDIKTIIEIALTAFQYPENPEWSIQDDEKEGVVESMNNLKRIWPLFNFLGIFAPGLRELLTGYIWEEDGQPGGLFLGQQRGASNTFYIGTVAVSPNFRRRGIARKLVEAGLDMFREKKGEIAILDVIDGNLPAYKLYESIGFEHFTGHYSLEIEPEGVYPPHDFPPGYSIEPSNLFNWQPRLALEEQILPENVKMYEPVEESRFRQPGYMRLALPVILRAQNTKTEMFLVRHTPSNQIVGYLRYDARTKAGGRHSISIRLDPDHTHLAQPMIATCLHQVTTIHQGHLVEFGVPHWQAHVYQAAKELGFETRLQMHRMGILL